MALIGAELPKNIGIDAIDLDPIDFSTIVSVDKGFMNNSMYIDPCKIYNVEFSSGSESLLFIEKNIVNTPYQSDNCNINAYSSYNSFNYTYFVSTDNIYTDGNNTIKPSENLPYTSSPPAVSFQNIYTEELKNEVKNIQAFAALDTGWIEFNGNTSISVNENIGTFNIEIDRVGGSEYFIQAAIENNDVTAVNGTDYSFVPVIVGYEHLDANSQTVSVNVLDNALTDGNRTFTLHLFAGNQLTLTHPQHNVLSVTIIDDEGNGDLIFKDGFE